MAAAAGLEFSKKRDIQDAGDLACHIRHLSLDKVQHIEAHLEEHFGTIDPDEGTELFAGVPDLPRYGLVGREPLLLDLITRLTSGDPVTLSTSGKGGAGKTVLAITAVHQRQLLKKFAGGVLWASVGPQGDPFLTLRS